MGTNDNKTDERRRNFLRSTVAGSAGAVIAAAAPGVSLAAVHDNGEIQDKNQSGYRLSQHILDYYKTCVR